MKRRNLILLLGGASSGVMSVGTGAFSSVKAERGVEVNVAEDENAYLGLRQNKTVVVVSGDAVREDETNAASEFLTVTNQFADRLALGVTLSGTEGNFDGVKLDVDAEDPIRKGEDPRDEELGEDDGLKPGDSASIGLNFEGVDFDRTTAGTTEITLDFYGNTGNATVQKTREFTISPVQIEFRGNSNSENNGKGGGAVHIYGDFSDLPVHINGNTDSINITSTDGKYVLTPSETVGPIEQVTIDGVVYAREVGSAGGGSKKENQPEQADQNQSDKSNSNSKSGD